MIRKHIYITAEQEAGLKRLSETIGLSESEIVRLALSSYLRVPSPTPTKLRAWQEERAFIQSLANNDPLPGERTWTRDGLYDL